MTKGFSYKEIKKCRVCGGNNLKVTLSLGEQHLTGVFPKSKDNDPSKGPVDLVLCEDCGLLQLKQSYSLDEMYGDNYGYRSGLNASMVKHLTSKIHKLEQIAALKEDDIVIDIGSNDATSLKAYTVKCKRIGIDPTSGKFAKYYTDGVENIVDFFSAKTFSNKYPGKKAKIITSIAMFYDLESPIDFAKDIASVLTDDGIWHFEQSYMPTMLDAMAYDTVCHEHLEFYSLSVIKYILEHSGMKIVDVELNDINGGSFAITACKENASYKVNKERINELLIKEEKQELNSIKPYQEFANNVEIHREKLVALLQKLAKDYKVFGYGASTKGNVLLQYCDIGTQFLPYIVEVNEEKFGSFTPGTHIPIISESEGEKMVPDYYLVLPWYFKDNILAREKAFLDRGGKFIFPLPTIQIIGKEDL